MKRFFGILLSLSILMGLLPSIAVYAGGDVSESRGHYSGVYQQNGDLSVCQHAVTAWEETKAPVGFEEGQWTLFCSDCGEAISTAPIYNTFGFGDEANADKTLIGFGEGVAPDELMAHFGKLGYEVVITDTDGNEADFVGTGILVSFGDTVYIVIVKGDIYSDGNIDIFDLMSLMDHVNGDAILEGVFLTAGLVYNEEEADIFDLMTLMDHVNGDAMIDPATPPSSYPQPPETESRDRS